MPSPPKSAHPLFLGGGSGHTHTQHTHAPTLHPARPSPTAQVVEALASQGWVRVVVPAQTNKNVMLVTRLSGGGGAPAREAAATITAGRERNTAYCCLSGVQHLRRLLDDAGFAAVRGALLL